MKSFVMTCVFLFSCGLLAAEDMKFVTLLSQPVGSFSRVELLDTSKPAEIFHLNFCNTDASGGTIAVSGSDTYPVQAEKLRVLDGATLGGNIKTFDVDTITIGADSTFDGFTGGTLHVTTTAPARIIVDEDSNEDNHTGSATFIHGKAVTINNVDFYTMDINNTAVLSSAASGSTKTSSLGWKQVSPSGTTDYPQGFVLTSHAGITPGDEDEDKEEGCTESYGSWTTATSSTNDTCDNNRISAYTCAGTAKTCTDVRRITASAGNYSTQWADPFMNFKDEILLAGVNTGNSGFYQQIGNTIYKWDTVTQAWKVTGLTTVPIGGTLITGGGGGTSSGYGYQQRSVVCCAN